MFPESIILVIGGETDDSESIVSALSDRYRVVGAENPEDALTHAADGINLVICPLESEFSPLQLVRAWRSRSRHTPFLFITDGSDVHSVIEVMRLGGGDCLVKPMEPSELRSAVARLLEMCSAMSAGAGSSSENDSHRGSGRTPIDIPPGTSLEELEHAAVEQALAQHQGNRTHAAKTLGISVRTLQRKLKAWGMPVMSAQNSGPGNNFLYVDQPDRPPIHSSFSGLHAH